MNIFQYSAVAEQNWLNNLAEMTNWKPKYTFYGDFSIADWYGESSIRDTYKNVIKSWGNGYEALTEIIMVLNHKSWAFACKVDSYYLGSRCTEQVRQRYIEVYSELYNKAVDFFFEKYKDDDKAKSYYYEVTD